MGKILKMAPITHDQLPIHVFQSCDFLLLGLQDTDVIFCYLKTFQTTNTLHYRGKMRKRIINMFLLVFNKSSEENQITLYKKKNKEAPFVQIIYVLNPPVKCSRSAPELSTFISNTELSRLFLVRWRKKGFHAYFSIPLTFPTVTPEIPLPYFHLSQLNQTFSQPLFVTHVSIFTHLHAPSLPLLSCPPPSVLAPGW